MTELTKQMVLKSLTYFEDHLAHWGRQRTYANNRVEYWRKKIKRLKKQYKID